MAKKEKDAKDPKEKIEPIYVRLSPEDMPRFDRIRKARGLKAATLVKAAKPFFFHVSPLQRLGTQGVDNRNERDEK